MRLANRVLLCVLAIFILSIVVSAQTPRSDNDPRNLSPSVGTGGPVGGPTGLFTIYDGQTLRKGEYTFSIAYSNYDRDPGNADITDIPLSFNVGLNDHLELFFNTTAYRGIKVNNPTNLSSFYLPNSQLFFTGTGLGSGPAIILAPSGPNVGTLAGTAVFRPPFFPAGNGNPGGINYNIYYTSGQPFVQSPFIGGIGPNFGQGPGVIGMQFGFPGFATAIGTPTGGNGNFGAASNYPGMGSVVGSILPGIVLATFTMPCTALTGNCRPPGLPSPQNPIVIPTVFTVSPTYLPDAPFVNRLYGQSSFSTFVAGAKWRISKPNNPLGFGLIPFYRWYADKPESGFNQLQRGASPGANIGDFGLIGFAEGRLSQHVNLSANLGYILNSNPKNGDAVLLDRPNEIISGVGFDFPINKHFQPLAEFRSTQYKGGTPNAFNNNPVEFTLGLKVYPRRWWGFGAWYRRQINDQRLKNFTENTSSIPIAQVTGVNVRFPTPRGIIIVPGTSVGQTFNGAPLGFIPSSDPHGFGLQIFAGHRRSREPSILPNSPPVISSFSASTAVITLPCQDGYHSSSNSCPASPNMSVGLTANASDPDGDTLLYTYTVSGGRVSGEGANVKWDLSGVGPGKYTATVEVDDGCGCISFSSTEVTIASCPDCVPNVVCPTSITASGPDAVEVGSSITYTANVVGSPLPPASGYNWSVSAGSITSGQGTTSITVSTNGLAGGSVTATVDVTGLDPSCPHTASATTAIRIPPNPPRKFDEYGNIRFNDEKARLDNFAIQLQNEPTAQGYIYGYGSCGSEGQERATRAKDYLVNTRGIDAGRLVVVDGGCKPELKVELWIVPQGATALPADTSGSVSPCPDCKKKPYKPRRRGRRGEE